MKKLILLTVILVTATVLITTLYFKNLNLPGHNAANIMKNIPADAALVFEFSNDDSFYSVYDSSALFTSLAGAEQLHELAVLRQQILQNATLRSYFSNQDIYLSVHPQGDLLVTLHSTSGISAQIISDALKQSNSGAQVSPFELDRVKGFTLTLPQLGQKLQVIERSNHTYAASFSTALIYSIIKQKNTGSNAGLFTPLPESQQNNALANLYVNYSGLPVLFDHWFKLKNTDYLKPLRLLPGNAALTLNYKSDALMFSGYTVLNPQLPAA